MARTLRTAVILLTLLSLLTGVVYPVLLTILASAGFPRQAHGSLIYDGQRATGSALVGQSFTQPQYFWGRPSMTQPVAYDGTASAASNFGPLHPDLRRMAEDRLAALRETNASQSTVPVDLVTASASGLDPHISPAAAEFQIPRVAAARGMSEDTLRDLVHRHIEHRQFGLLGEPRVNVLLLNLALD